MEVATITITAKKDGFRRGGMAHSGEGITYPLDCFNEKQLTAIEAEPMLVTHRGVAEKQAASGGDVDPNLLAVIGKLDPANKDHFTNSGKPELKALGELLGRSVSSAERDAAFEAFKTN